MENNMLSRRLSLFADFRYIVARIIKRLRLSAIRHSSINAASKIGSDCQIVSSRLDRYSYCGSACVFINAEIGAFCSISDNVYIGGSGHPMSFVSTSPAFLSHKDGFKKKFATFDYLDLPRTLIGSDVWIGMGAFIRAGVEIGHGAVVGMGSVVTKDVPAYSIVAGNPAKLVRYRFDDETIRRLLATHWWEMPEQELRHWGAYFNDPVRFLQEWESR